MCLSGAAGKSLPIYWELARTFFYFLNRKVDLLSLHIGIFTADREGFYYFLSLTPRFRLVALLWH